MCRSRNRPFDCGGSKGGLAGSYTKARRYQKTQENVLRSRALAERVVDRLGLAVPHRQPPKRKPSWLAEWKNTLKAWIKGKDAGKRPTGDGPVNQKKPETLANAYADAYREMSVVRQFEASMQAEQFLEVRIAQARVNLEDSEKELVAYAKEREIVDPEDRLGTLMQTLNALNGEFTRVEAERIKARSEYDQSMKRKGPAAVQVMDDAIIQALRARQNRPAIPPRRANSSQPPSLR